MRVHLCLLWRACVVAVAIVYHPNHGLESLSTDPGISALSESANHDFSSALETRNDMSQLARSRFDRRLLKQHEFLVPTPAHNSTTTPPAQSLKGSILIQVRTLTFYYHCSVSGNQEVELEYAVYYYVDLGHLHFVGLSNIEHDFHETFIHEGRYSSTFGGKFHHIFCPRRDDTPRVCTYHISGVAEGRYNAARGWLMVSMIRDDPSGYFSPVVTETCNPVGSNSRYCPVPDPDYSERCKIRHISEVTPKGVSSQSNPRKPPKHHGPPQ